MSTNVCQTLVGGAWGFNYMKRGVEKTVEEEEILIMFNHFHWLDFSVSVLRAWMSNIARKSTFQRNTLWE